MHKIKKQTRLKSIYGKKVLNSFGVRIVKNKIISFAAIVFLISLAVGVAKINAGNGENATGWLWGGSEDSNLSTCAVGSIDCNESGIGWISMNNINTEISPAGSISYGVNIPQTGDVTGYAWNQNIGWIDFDPQHHCTTGIPDATHYRALSCVNPYNNGNGGVVRNADNTISGWARIVGIAQETVSGNAGGQTGWIKMDAWSGTSYAVSVTSSGKLTGYAWADSSLGAINFGVSTSLVNGNPVGGMEIPPPPAVVLTTTDGSDVVYVEPAQRATAQTINLRWTFDMANGGTVNSCTASSDDASNPWNPQPTAPQLIVDGTSGPLSVNLATSTSVRYTISCSGPGGNTQSTVLVTLSCVSSACNDGTGACDLGARLTGNQAIAPGCSVGCSVDNNQCKKKSVEVFKEIAP